MRKKISLFIVMIKEFSELTFAYILRRIKKIIRLRCDVSFFTFLISTFLGIELFY